MKIRAIYCSALFLFLFFSLAGISASAEEVITQPPKPPTATQEPAVSNTETAVTPSETAASNTAVMSTLELKAKVAESFEQTILLNFTTVEKENVMARLDKVNGYVFSQEVNPGTYKVDFINIVGENATNYDIKAPEQIVIKEGDDATFDMQVALKPTAKQSVKTEPVKPVPGITTSPNAAVPIPTLDRPTAENAPIPEANQQILAVHDAQKSSAKIDASVFKSIIGLGVVLLLGLLIFIYKKISYKHDYYDC